MGDTDRVRLRVGMRIGGEGHGGKRHDQGKDGKQAHAGFRWS